MMLQTTFALAKKYNACTESYKRMAKALGGVKKYGKDTPFTLLLVLDVLGFNDALWALQCVLPEQEKERDRIARLFACDCVEMVIHIFEDKYPDDKRPRAAIEVARRYTNGSATDKELSAARADSEFVARAAKAAAMTVAESADWFDIWSDIWSDIKHKHIIILRKYLKGE